MRESGQGLTQGRNLEPGTDAQTLEGCCLLACSSGYIQLLFLYHPGSPAQGWDHPQWAWPSHIQNFPLTCLQANLMEAFFSVEATISQMTLVWVKLTKH